MSLSRKTSRTLYISQRYKKTGAAQFQCGWVRWGKQWKDVSSAGAWRCRVSV